MICFFFICRYGDEFMMNTYLYHITRRDIRHNFSVYFYLLYLTSSSETSAFLAISAFLPQLLVILLITAKFHRDIEFTSFLLTFVFVTFNKVCTSQVWNITSHFSIYLKRHTQLYNGSQKSSESAYCYIFTPQQFVKFDLLAKKTWSLVRIIGAT